MALNQQKVKKLIALFRQQYPNWKSFSDPIDPDFQRNEIDYEQDLIAKAKSQLAEPQLQQLIDAADYNGLITVLQSVVRDKSNKLLHLKSSSDLNILKHPDLDKQAFGRSIQILLHGNDTSEARLNGYLDLVKRHRLPNTWTFPTYFLFLCHPDTDIFVKPVTIEAFLKFIGEEHKFASMPSARSYVEIKQIAHQLKDLLHDYAPRDMVDIQSFIQVCMSSLNNQPRYWKIAPGENAWQWNDCRHQNFIAIGWDELGDISGLSRKQFDAQRDGLIAQHPEWKWSKNGVNQVWVFSQIKEGDRIVANKGTSEIVGIGTVTGSYYYDANANEYKHRLSVQWDDTTTRSISEPGWVRTLIALNAAKFAEICGDTTVNPNHPNPPEQFLKLHPDCAFTSTTFDLLAELHANPKKATYLARRDEFKRELEERFQKLFRQVAAQLPKSIQERMETQRKLFARIPKNDFKHGGAWDFYWGAFYAKGGKRIEDAQLFLWMNHDRLEFGFYIGQYGSQQRKRFLKNCQDNRAALLSLLEDSLADSKIWNGSRANPTYLTWAEWLQDPSQQDIHVSVAVPKQEVLNTSTVELTTQILETYKLFFPLVLLALDDNPMPALLEYLEPDEPEDINVTLPPYTLSDCAQETYRDIEELKRWVQAIERKKQAVLYGPPGTGKTFLAQKLAKHLISEGDGFVEIVQFHPAYTYEDFIQGIRPKRVDSGLDYPTVPGRFLEFCRKAKDCRKTCVLIIDEINRANLSQVFGELMYLLEYRDEKIYLASGEAFSIPKNVRIIGTMNTADRSIALVDHALRRRFAFLYLPPDHNGLRKFHASTGFAVEKLISQLKQINAQICDHHYEIGTSFFLCSDLETQLQSIWQLEIEPYLEEFFFDQPDKVKSFQWEAVKNQLVP